MNRYVASCSACPPQLKRDPSGGRGPMRLHAYYLLLSGLAIACWSDARLKSGRTALDSLNGQRLVAVIISDSDPNREYAFAATARSSGTRLWLAPMPTGAEVVVPLDSDGHPPVFELTGEARQVLIYSSQHAAMMTRLSVGARFAAVFQSNSVPSGAIPVPGLVALANVPGWHR